MCGRAEAVGYESKYVFDLDTFLLLPLLAARRRLLSRAGVPGRSWAVAP
jgi:hypothetical protein